MYAQINKALCEYFNAPSSTLYIQLIDEKMFRKAVFHVIPRKAKDLTHDEIYLCFPPYAGQLLQFNH
jgi:hypothetical protein